MGRLQWLAENTGASLGAAGVLVAAVATALGLTQAGDGWLVLGIVLAVGAVAWSIVTLWAAKVQSTKSETFRQALARAQREGDDLLRSGPDDARADAWVQKVHDLIAAGLGEAEAELFMSDHDIHVGMKVATELRVPTDAETQMELRLQRLSRLLDRIHSMSARIDFDPTRWGLGRANGPATRG
jgi:hypothetical protein